MGEKPAGEKLIEKKLTEGKPTGERLSEEKLTEGKPTGERLSEEGLPQEELTDNKLTEEGSSAQAGQKRICAAAEKARISAAVTRGKKILKIEIKLFWKAAGFLLLFLMPIFSYLIFETITGNLQLIWRERAILNILWIAVFYLAVFAISGTSRFTVPVVSLLLFVLAVAETLVEEFRGTPIMIWDLLAVKTAMTVAENYVIELTDEMWEAGRALLWLNLLVMIFPARLRWWKEWLIGGMGFAGAAAAFVVCFYASIVPGQGLEINMWDMNNTYQHQGYVLVTAISLKYIVKKPPQGYSAARVEEICARMAEKLSDENEQPPVQPVNLICIMNESLSDLHVVGDFRTNCGYLSYVNGLRKNTVRGSLCMPVFGAWTSNSEFEFLTGDSIALLPSGVIAYQFYVKPDTCSLVSTLRNQGYEAVAMHPYPAENWNRDKCYPNLGFDRFVAGDDYKGCETIRNYVSDRADYQKIIELVEQKKNPDDKLFVFNVTMQNHGGYEGTYENFEENVHLTGSMRGKYPKTDQYLSLVKRSDEAFRGLVEYFERKEEPTMIVMFGDHQPGVEDEFFDEIYGVPSIDVPAGERLMWYETPFVIWTNYEQPNRDMGRLGAVFLSSHVLKLANLELTPFNRFLLEMSEKIPVVHPIGCYEKDGTFYSWEEARSETCPYQQLIEDYECLVYNHSLERESRELEEMFTVWKRGGDEWN